MQENDVCLHRAFKLWKRNNNKKTKHWWWNETILKSLHGSFCYDNGIHENESGGTERLDVKIDQQ